MTNFWDQPTATETFNATGSSQTWVVPNNVSWVHVRLYGAGTGSRNGGYVEGYLDVTPGETLYIYVGESNSGTSGGFPGGGNGSRHEESSSTIAESDGGAGYTAIRQGGDTFGDTVVLAGGAGGRGDASSDGGNSDSTGGTNGGSDVGGSAGDTIETDGAQAFGGHGGSQSSGGSGGSPNGGDGSQGSGGGTSASGYTDGNFNEVAGAGGGGGAGYYGGGGGGNDLDTQDNPWGLGAGGGGGSSYVGGLHQLFANSRGGGNPGDGVIEITYYT